MDFYHVLNRGVDKRVVVLDDSDRVRFVHDLFAFNDEEHVLHGKLQARVTEKKKRKLLVNVHTFSLMPNHFHLLLSPRVENGVSLFMKKLCMGYAKYFNERYERSGALWEGKYKRIRIERDAHFMYIPYYIHLNPLDIEYPEWRTGNVMDVEGALKFLNCYRWSSHLDYSGVKNFPSIIDRSAVAPMLGTTSEYVKRIVKIITQPGHADNSAILEK